MLLVYEEPTDQCMDHVQFEFEPERINTIQFNRVSDIRDIKRDANWLNRDNINEPYINIAPNIQMSNKEKKLLFWYKPVLSDINLFIASHDKYGVNKAVFNEFVKKHKNDPKYINKYVVFVGGQLYDAGDTDIELIKKVHENFGNVKMYVGNISRKIQTGLIESPELF